MYTCVDSYVIIYIYYKMVFCNHNTMRGSCCLRCIHLLFLLIFLLSISTLSINLYLSTFYQFISTRLIFIILCLNFSNFSNFSVTYQLSANLSRSVNFCGGLALASLGFAECFDISTFRHFDISTFRHRLSLFDPRFEVPMFAPRRSPKC